MKMLLLLLFGFVLIYCVYFDLHTGTLPIINSVSTVQDKDTTALTNLTNDQPFVEVTIKPGDTVLSLLEQRQSGNLPVSISKVVTDFQRINNGQAPEKLQIGKKYKLPLYK